MLLVEHTGPAFEFADRQACAEWAHVVNANQPTYLGKVRVFPYRETVSDRLRMTRDAACVPGVVDHLAMGMRVRAGSAGIASAAEFGASFSP